MTVAYDILATGSNLRLKQDFLGISSIVLVHAGGAKMLFDTGGYIARYGLLDALKARGHRIKVTQGPFGGYQAIWRESRTGVYWGASEMRKDGMAVGY